MNELERVEAQAARELVALAGGRVALVGGAQCISYPTAGVIEANRGFPLGATVNVAAIAAWFGVTPHAVCVPPGYVGLEESLRAQGYTPGDAWMKFERGDADAPPADTDLRIEETLDAEAFALAAAEGSGMPLDLVRVLFGIVGAPGWRCFVAFDGDEPAACGALYADGEYGWVGIGATRPAFRRRGAHLALLAARIDAARRDGVRRLAVETGERVAGATDQSYRNLLRAGFREAYLRPNWHSPT